MEKKAWLVDNDDDDRAIIIFAETRGQARKRGADEFLLNFTQVRARRAPQFDQYAETGKVPPEAYLEDGWWYECEKCGCLATKKNGAVVIDGLVYCEECGQDIREAKQVEAGGKMPAAALG